MRNTMAIFHRELRAYFSTPVGYVFIAIFLFLMGLFTFSMGGFYENRQATLLPFFDFHPWLYLFMIPAVSMRLWAEERKSGTIELLMTLPVSLPQAVIGKFLAAWVFVVISLALTFPFVITVHYLGEPDNGVIAAGYLGSILMAGAFLGIGCCISALTKNQVISFILAVVICFLFMLTGFSVVNDWFVNWAPDWLMASVNAMSFTAHFRSIERGVIKLDDVVYFLSMMAAWLYVCGLILETKKAD